MPGLIRTPPTEPHSTTYVFVSDAAAYRFAIIVALIVVVVVWWVLQVRAERACDE